MSNYQITADTGCDISPEILKRWGVDYCQLTFKFDGEDKEYKNFDISTKDFYGRMRKGDSAKTSAVNPERFKELFKKYLDKGMDVLYIGFSSGISTTVNSGAIAAEELKEEYPDRKIIVVDTLAASSGCGLLLKFAVDNKRNGMTLEENAANIESRKLGLSHWFTVDDLVYLKRGGRISPTVAFVGNLLGVKPVLHVDDEGHLINVTKVRSRKASLKMLVDKCREALPKGFSGPVFISHADSIDDAKFTADYFKERTGVKVELISDVGPIIGAHAGPGTIALFAEAAHR
ncbi:MAG: DegV family protein [Lachnospiraceae bacterium]|nr:DegV family protein [Lachnospiraceae bacterium]